MDDLDTPLGQHKAPQPGKLISARLAGQVVAGGLALAVIGFAVWAVYVRDPSGGEPIATAPIAPPVAVDASAAKPVLKPEVPAESAATPAPPAIPPGSQTITIIDGSSGKRQEFVIPGTGDGKRSAVDPRMLEPSRHGLIPRIATDGARPSLVYARKAISERSNPDRPQIAIVIGGLGSSAKTAAEVLSKLPPNVTLAFTPYGNDLEGVVARARNKGHEILLQAPMEPNNYPDNDPGPQTLLSTLSSDQNIDRLHWLLSRMQGYVGVINHMGARFTASDAAFAPVLREVARRGLIFVDDGSSSRSRAAQIAGANKLPFAGTDIVIDTVPSSAEIDNALKRLETIARERGSAVGFASALPVSLDRISAWTKGAESRGLSLVPITRVAIKTGSS